LDDFSIANLSVLKTLKSFSEQSDSFARILPLFKDKDDQKYSFDLLNKTLVNSYDYKSMIAETSSNWDEDRISDMDQLLLQMAICELLNFETIPVKVTINEYIELSKDYSSQKSRGFINGIIDKLAIRFKKRGDTYKVR
jgi:N utilization substance protein B